MSQVVQSARERLRRKAAEYHRLERELRELENTNFRVCLFGSARVSARDPLYGTVFDLARTLSEHGIDIVTGGGPGLMEAANRGVRAARGGGASYGLPIQLPTLSELPNSHLDVNSGHQRFSTRLDEFLRLSHAVVLAPGGVGTFLELGYVWQHVQLGAIDQRPMVLLGKSFWEGLVAWSREQQLANHLLDARDLESLSMADTPEEALPILLDAHARFLVERQAALEDALEAVEHPLSSPSSSARRARALAPAGAVAAG